MVSDRLLDVAEHHFGQLGYRGASLPGIAEEAGEPGRLPGKRELMEAAVHRFAEPVVREQVERLAHLPRPYRAEDLLRAFFIPPIRRIHGMGPDGPRLALFLARLQMEDDRAVEACLESRFARAREAFLGGLRRLLPGLGEREIHWRFELCLGALLTFLHRQPALRSRLGLAAEWTPEQAVEDLVRFCTRGI
jgi:AcrR family transcriptional regulator